MVAPGGCQLPHLEPRVARPLRCKSKALQDRPPPQHIYTQLHRIVPRPRVIESFAGTGNGGGFLHPAPPGASPGAVASPTEQLPLDAALAEFVTDKKLQFGGFERLRWNCIRVVFGRGANFFYVDADVPPDRARFSSVEALEDALYDAATRRIDKQVRKLGLR